MYDPAFAHPAVLPGEPVRSWSAFGTARILLVRALSLLLALVVTLPFWPSYLLLRLIYGRPPNVCSLSHAGETARLIVTTRDAHGPTTAMRVGLLLELALRMVLNGPRGLAWLVDEVIWGRKLAQVKLVEPLFEISAARSGSTQISHYLEDEPHLCAPNALQIGFPYLWLWRLFPHVEPLLPKDWRERFGHAAFPKEHHERHELDVRRTDTFEVIWLVVHQLGDLAMALGPDVLVDYYGVDQLRGASRRLWEDDFLRFIEGIGRRTMFAAAPAPDGEPRRFFIKGHFLLVAEQLAERYPDARFLTVLRAPEKRFQSLINFLRCQGSVAPCPAIPWPWVVRYTCTAEVAYCEREMEWFQRQDGRRRCVVPFDAYLRDLEGTMRTVFRECLDRDLSPHVPRVHAPRVRENYSVDRSLAQLGIDEAALKTRLAAYGRWCRGL